MVLSARTDNLVKPFEQAEKKTTKLGKAVSGVGSRLKGIAKNIFSARFAMLAFAGAFAAVSATLIFYTKKAFGAIDATHKLALRTGVGTRQLGALQHAAGLAGVESESLAKGIEKFSLQLSKAAAGGKTGEKIRANFASIGLSVDDLLAKDVGGAFADFRNQIAGSATASADAFLILGGSALKIKNLLALTNEEMAALTAEADKLGILFDDVEAEQVAMANDALSKMTSLLVGLGQQIAIKISPYITALSNEIVALGANGEDTGGKLISAFEGTVKAIGYIIDAVNFLKTVFFLLRIGVNTVIQGVIWTINLAGKAITALIDLIPGVEAEWTDALDIMHEELQDKIDKDIQNTRDSWEKVGKATETVNGVLERTREKSEAIAKAAQDAVKQKQLAARLAAIEDAKAEERSKRFEKLRKLVTPLVERKRDFGKTDDQKKLEEIARAAQGLSDTEFNEIIAQSRLLLAQIRKQEQQEAVKKQIKDRIKGFIDEGKALKEKLMKPMEKYRKELKRIRSLEGPGFIDAETARRAREKALQDLQGAQGETGTPQLLEAGSAAAQRFMFNAGRNQETVQDKQLQQQEDIATNTKQTADAVIASFKETFRIGV